MIEKANLHQFITEELYLVKEEKGTDTTSSPEKKEVATAAPLQVEETKQAEQNEVPDQTNEHIPEKESNQGADRSAGKIDQMLIATEYLSNEDRELLQKIMSAVDYTEDNYKIAIGSSKEIPLHNKAIIFTKNPKMDLYQVSDYKGTELLVSRSLAELHQSVADKKMLWVALKKWFNKA